jgi:hypothetical protein
MRAQRRERERCADVEQCAQRRRPHALLAHCALADRRRAVLAGERCGAIACVYVCLSARVLACAGTNEEEGSERRAARNDTVWPEQAEVRHVRVCETRVGCVMLTVSSCLSQSGTVRRTVGVRTVRHRVCCAG